MKPTTQARILTVLNAAGITSDMPMAMKNPLHDAIIKALTEQDRNTRHACAEAAQSRLTNLDTIDPIAAGAIAYQACINTQAV